MSVISQAIEGGQNEVDKATGGAKNEWDKNTQDIQNNNIGGTLGDFIADPFSTFADVLVYISNGLKGPQETAEPAVQNAPADAAGLSYSHIYASNYPLPVVYGRRMINGHITYLQTQKSNRELLMVISLCEGEISSIDDVYLDDLLIRENGVWKTQWSGFITSVEEDADRIDYVRFNTTFNDFYLGGDAGQGTFADAGFGTSYAVEWREQHKLQGVAHIRLALAQDDTGNAWQGMPQTKFVVKGKKVYDPRNGSTAWSDNPALCLLDYLRNERYGASIPDAEIDFDSFKNAADYCDQSIDLYDGNTGARYRCNYTVNTGNSIVENIRALVASCNGVFYWSNGLYTLEIPQAGSAPVLYIDENMIIGSVQLSGENKGARFNRVSASYINEFDEWQPSTVYWPEDDTYLQQDNNTPAELTLTLDWETSPYRARNFCKQTLLRSRNALGIQVTVTSEALECTPNSLVALSYSSFGFDQKLFRVQDLSLNPDGTVGLLLLEHDDAIYDPATNSAYVPPADTTLPTVNTIERPKNLQITETLYETTGSAGVKARANLTWAPVDDGYFDFYEYEFKLNSLSTWQDGGITRTEYGFLDDLAPGSWDFRVRAVNVVGKKSSWTTATAVTIEGLTAAPNDVQNFSVVQINDQAHIFWDAPTDLDVKIGGRLRVRHYPSTTGASWSGSNDLASNLPPNNCYAILPFLPGTYLAKFYDSTGNSSETAAVSVVSESTYNSTTIDQTITLDPTFPGTLTDMVVEDSQLKLAPTTVTFGGTDLLEGHILDATGDTLTDTVSGSANTVSLSGNITFSSSYAEQWLVIGLQVGESYVSIGQVSPTGSYLTGYTEIDSTAVVRRVTANIGISSSQILTADPIDVWPLLSEVTDWDSGSHGVDDVKATCYLSTTTDDPAGSPTWTSFSAFRVADIKARAVKFKVVSETENANHQIAINSLNFELTQKA